MSQCFGKRLYSKTDLTYWLASMCMDRPHVNMLVTLCLRCGPQRLLRAMRRHDGFPSGDDDDVLPLWRTMNRHWNRNVISVAPLSWLWCIHLPMSCINFMTISCYRKRLCSASTTTLVIPRTHHLMISDRVFCAATPHIGNDLPHTNTSLPSLTIFWHRLKTHLFLQSYRN